MNPTGKLHANSIGPAMEPSPDGGAMVKSRVSGVPGLYVLAVYVPSNAWDALRVIEHFLLHIWSFHTSAG